MIQSLVNISFLSLIAAAALGVGSVQACMVNDFIRTETTHKPNCAEVRTVRGEPDVRGLKEAQDLGNGFVMQTYFARSDEMMVLLDCSNGNALVMGPREVRFGYCPMFGDELAEYERLVRAAPMTRVEETARQKAKGGTLELSDLMDEFGAQFYDAALVSLKNRVKISYKDDKPRKAFDLSCGCKLYYPDSTGANS